MQEARPLTDEKEERGEGDSLTSPATSAVLFNLILGRRSPIEISRSVGDTPPAIIKHLWKLRKENLVTIAEKSGKLQNYSVNWDRLVKSGLELMTNFKTAMVLASLRGDEEKHHMLDDIGRKLSENEHFKSLFKAFMEEEAKKRETEDVYLVTTKTFKDAVEKFEKFLPQLLPLLKTEFAEQEKAQLIKSLKVLCEAIEEAQDYESKTLKNALHITGLL
jgi:predicted transcriptional regulator